MQPRHHAWSTLADQARDRVPLRHRRAKTSTAAGGDAARATDSSVAEGH